MSTAPTETLSQGQTPQVETPTAAESASGTTTLTASASATTTTTTTTTTAATSVPETTPVKATEMETQPSAPVSPPVSPPVSAPVPTPIPAPTPVPVPVPVSAVEAISAPEEKKEEKEKSPKGRYIRFEELGRGSFKVVYKAFDSETGKTVAWNEVNIMSLPPTEKKRVISEVKILEKVNHQRIISFYGSWYDAKNHKVVFMTERVTEGSLRSFCEKVSGLKLSVVRKWSEQILDGLCYLHSQSPPIIHRDLKCENVFVKGEDGSIKIGDLGLSTQALRDKNSPGTVLGTPEFMAPELYSEKYDETVDVYAFGLVLLEMISMETPYSECTNIGQIIQKVTSGAEPDVLCRVKIPALKDFVKFCLGKQSFEGEEEKRRPSAQEVYDHPFMTSERDNDRKDLVWKRGEEMVVEPGSDIVENKNNTNGEGKDKDVTIRTATTATTTTTTHASAKMPAATTTVGGNTSIETSTAQKVAENKAKKLAEEAEVAQRAQKEAEEKARQLQEAARQAHKEAEQRKRENKAREEELKQELAKAEALKHEGGVGGSAVADNNNDTNKQLSNSVRLMENHNTVGGGTIKEARHSSTTAPTTTAEESKTKSQDELMRLVKEARETDKKKKEEDIRANSPTQVAKREAADLAEFNSLSQEVDSELNGSSKRAHRDPTDSVVSTSSSVYPEMSPRASMDTTRQTTMSTGGEGSDGNSDVLDDAKKASRGRSNRNNHSSSTSGTKKVRKRREKLEWKIRVSKKDVVEKNKHLSDNLTVAPIFSLFETVTKKVPAIDPKTKKEIRDNKGRVVLEKRTKEARRLVFPFSVLSESPHEMVCEIARDGYLKDLRSPDPRHPDFKLPLKETDFDRISDELTRMKNEHALTAVEWWCKEKAKLDVGREKGRSIWSVSRAFFPF